jgi:hypothetical protein
MTLKELANNPKLLNEVEELAQSLYRTIKQTNGQDLPIARCWVLAVDTVLSGAKEPAKDNVIKLRGR